MQYSGNSILSPSWGLLIDDNDFDTDATVNTDIVVSALENFVNLTCRISDNEISLFSHASRYQMSILQKEMIFCHFPR